MSSGRAWTQAEDLMIVGNYANHGPSWPGWAEMMPDRGTTAIRNRAARLGVRAPVESPTPPPAARTARPWGDRQRKALVRLFAVAQDATGHSAADCSAELARLLEQHGKHEGADGPRRHANDKGV